MKLKFLLVFLVHVLFLGLIGCDPEGDGDGDLTKIEYSRVPYELELPSYWPKLESPQDNPLTKAGVKLGQHLFYDPILSADSTMSCSSCHMPEFGFTDGKRVSKGIDGIAGTKSSMSLFNIAFTRSGFFWDGRSKSLEAQALLPVEDPIELHHEWIEVEKKFRTHPTYPTLFRQAFGIENKSEITKDLAAKAMAQFQRILVTPNSKYDRVLQGKERYTNLELLGEGLFFDDDPDLPDAECNHCHSKPLMTADDFFNNGLQQGDGNLNFPDNGRGLVTNNVADNGKFKAVSLRNIALTAPYMHDGRLASLEEVIDHYNSGGHPALNKDALVRPLNLDPLYKEALIAFMHTLTDTTYLSNPDVLSPF